MRLRTLLTLAALAAPAAPLALAQATPAPTTAPASAASYDGPWTYAIDTPQGVLRGTFVFATSADGVFSGTMSNPMGEGASPLTGVSRLGKVVTASFDSGQYGVLTMRLAFNDAGDAYTGAMSVMGMEIGIAGARKADG